MEANTLSITMALYTKYELSSVQKFQRHKVNGIGACPPLTW